MEIFKGLNNFLFIGAHYDDVEIGCGGLIKKLSENKYFKLNSLVLTDTHYVRNDRIERDKKIVQKEAIESSKILGVNLTCLNFKLNHLKCNDDLVTKMREYIENNNIDVIFTHWHGDIHPDHREAYCASVSASRHLNNILMYKSNNYASGHFFNGNIGIDISKQMKYKIKALQCYESEILRKGKKFIDNIVIRDKNIGLLYNVKYAEQFEVIKFII